MSRFGDLEILADIARLIQNQKKRTKHKLPLPRVINKANLLLLVVKIIDDRKGEKQLDTLLTQHKHKHKEWPTNLKTMFAVWEEQSMAALEWIGNHIEKVKR